MASNRTADVAFRRGRAGRPVAGRRRSATTLIVLALILLAAAAGIVLAGHGWPWAADAAALTDGFTPPATEPPTTQPPAPQATVTQPPPAQPPSPPAATAGKTIRVAIDRRTSAATVSLYEGDKLVAAYDGYGGAAESPSLVGKYKVTAHLGTIHTTLYQSELGHDFYLKAFLQFKGNYGFHAYKINDQTMEPEPGPTHGCVALSEADAASLYEWADVGTAVESEYK